MKRNDRLLAVLASALASAALASGALSACGGDKKPPADTATTTDSAAGTAGDTGVAVGGSGAGARQVAVTRGFDAPEAIEYDADLDVWFVANVNGTPSAKDGNGYISRLKSDGSIETKKFIQSGRKGVTLNAPKGMATVGDTLWVADLDVARAFNKRTGAPIATVTMPTKARFLNGAAAGPDGVYMTDTGVNDKFEHPGPDQIFRIAGRKATVALTSAALSGPNGIAWDAAKKRFIIVPFMGTNILSWAPGAKAPQPLGAGPGQQDGVLSLADGRILSTSWTDSSLFVMQHGGARQIARPVPSPADIDINPKTQVVGVPLLMENRVEFWSLR
ncbi:MAG: hypothetical protein H0W67_00275 [Gemmatimonadales bacterium]|nr:hypothetical protein [Gemmatimonadales bacterium]